MARPRITRLENGGEIILKNVPKEQADAIQALVADVAATEAESSVSVSRKEFPTKALTVYYNRVTLKYELVSVEVDPATQETGEVKVLASDNNKRDVIIAFKKEAIELNIVT